MFTFVGDCTSAQQQASLCLIPVRHIFENATDVSGIECRYGTNYIFLTSLDIIYNSMHSMTFHYMSNAAH